jgi:PTH1 family peptidyl-tRNA hydrolase
VLSDFTDEEKELLPERIETACDVVRTFCLSGIDVAMNLYNNK